MISVIICAYEQPLAIGWLLESLTQQTFKGPFEVLIADDGSDPQVLAIVKEVSWRLPLDIRYIWQPDAGFRLCRSRNNAIRLALGELLIFLDGDMVVRPDFIQTHVAAHATGDKILLCGTRETLRIRADRPPKNPEEVFLLTEQTSHIEAVESEYPQQEAWSRSQFPWMAISGSNFSIRKAPEIVFDEAFTGWGTEDREFACRIQKLGYQIVVTDAARAVHVELIEPKGTRHQVDENREHRELTELIRNKLLMRRLHPDVDTTPSIRMLQNCSIDPGTGHWSYDPAHVAIDLNSAIDSAEMWMDQRGLEFRPAGPRA